MTVIYRTHIAVPKRGPRIGSVITILSIHPRIEVGSAYSEWDCCRPKGLLSMRLQEIHTQDSPEDDVEDDHRRIGCGREGNREVCMMVATLGLCT